MDKIHLKSPIGWINDPNGFIYYKGKYHLFYQHFPFAPKWGRMHWGHAVSDDLSAWEHLDTALFPSKIYDADGCFSGSAVEYNEKMYITYTGVKYDVPDPENTNCCLDDKFTAAQLMITSSDGYSFDNFGGKKVIIPPIEDNKIGDKNHTRDPKVWRGKDAWYIVLGSTVNDKGRLLFYKSTDLENWKYVNCFSKDNYGWMWECPDYFEVGGRGVLIFSPIGLPEGSQAVCVSAQFDEEKCEMEIPDNYRFFDYGLDLYAPQSTVDKEGRRVVIAWLRSPESPDGKSIGMYSIPRVCEVRNGHIYFAPHPDVRGKFTENISSPKEANEGQYKFSVSFSDGEKINVGGYIIGRAGSKIFTDRSSVIRNHTECKAYCETPDLMDGYDIEVFVSPNIVEVYVNGGEYVITNAVYDLTDEFSSEKETDIFTIK